MRLSKSMWQTFKEIPKEAEVPSHQLMLRAGLIHKSAAGIYCYLPFAKKSLLKIENIIREEMDAIGCQEITMSIVTPSELWKETGRWDVMGPDMLKAKDRGQKDICISPTNEEAVTDIFRKAVKSYKQLPTTLYQINTKFRDEIRPRFGLLRGREFTMKDAYSFHENKACLDKVYNDIYHAYSRIFKRFGLDFMIVEADAGNMGSSDSKTHEFQVLAQTGEDWLVYNREDQYAANIEKAVTKRAAISFAPPKLLKEVQTIDKSSIKDVCEYLNIPQHHSLKSLLYSTITGSTEKIILVLLLGDDELNPVKLKNYLNCDHLVFLEDHKLAQHHLVKGFLGPINLPANIAIEVIYDSEVNLDSSYVVGANKKDYHYEGFVPRRDFQGFKQTSLRMAKEGDETLDGKKVGITKGIEVGHIFQLGKKYTQSMNSTVLGQDGKPLVPMMGCYGIGVTRSMAAAIEQSHDDKGIIWPMAIAPYHVYFAVIAKTQETKDLATEIYEMLKKNKIEVLFDDRDLSPGVMFKDADLLGLPMRVTLGERDYKENGMLEIKIRKDETTEKVSKDHLIERIKFWMENL